MTYEVENKFHVIDVVALERMLERHGAELEDPILQIDHYYAHPSRDFAKTDEALRIRRVGDENFLTYKGPKIDASTKTRKEIEVSVGAGDESAKKFSQVLEALGFSEVAEVRKCRRLTKLECDGQAVEVAVDEVEDLGGFVELELKASDATLDAARQCLHSLAEKLELGKPERRSYLELLLSSR